MSKYKLIVGLGNYPKEYNNTRHNIGFNVIDLLLKELKLVLDKEKFDGKYCIYKSFIFAKPFTYMNNSGLFVNKICKFYKIEANEVYTISDDMSMEVGKIRFRNNGSAGGHNGLKSIIENLGSENFNRYKIGIGMPIEKTKINDYVCGKFKKEEQTIINKSIKEVVSKIITELKI
jgi:PTH1 family peptidyl-tRNA hydrolase